MLGRRQGGTPFAASDAKPTPFPPKPVSLTAERERHPVIVSKYDKSYDTADGSEQQFDDPTAKARGGGRAASQRWQDDGAPPNERPPVDPAGAGPYASKPAWSVLSLRDLNTAVGREQRADDPARLQQEAERAERRQALAAQVAEDKAAAAARAYHDRDRNAWETT